MNELAQTLRDAANDGKAWLHCCAGKADLYDAADLIDKQEQLIECLSGERHELIIKIDNLERENEALRQGQDTKQWYPLQLDAAQPTAQAPSDAKDAHDQCKARFDLEVTEDWKHNQFGSKWQYFCDESYPFIWTVMSANSLQRFHVPSEREAVALCEMLGANK